MGHNTIMLPLREQATTGYTFETVEWLWSSSSLDLTIQRERPTGMLYTQQTRAALTCSTACARTRVRLTASSCSPTRCISCCGEPTCKGERLYKIACGRYFCGRYTT